MARDSPAQSEEQPSGQTLWLWAGCNVGSLLCSNHPVTAAAVTLGIQQAALRATDRRLDALQALATRGARLPVEMAACVFSQPRARAAVLCCFLLAASQATARPVPQPGAARSLIQQPGKAAAGVTAELRTTASATPTLPPTTQSLTRQVRSTPELPQAQRTVCV